MNDSSSGALILYGHGFAPRSHAWTHFWLSQWGWGSATSIQWVEARDAVEPPKMQRAGPSTKNDVAPKVDSAEVGKPALDCESHVPFGHPILSPAPTE